MKPYTFRETKSLSFHLEKAPSVQKTFRVNSDSSGPYEDNNYSKIHEISKCFPQVTPVQKNKLYLLNSNPIGSYEDFINLRNEYKDTDKTSCLSDKINDKDYRLQTCKSLFKNLMTELDINNNELKAKTKKLTIKILTTCKQDVERTFPIKNQIRIYDVQYPLDSSFIITQEKYPEHLILGDYSEFKRVTQMIFDKKEQDYTYLIEEKFPGMADKAYFDRNLEYYSSWLDSQSNEDSHQMATALRTRYNKDFKVSRWLNSDKLKSNHLKIYIHQLSENVLQLIKSMPYIRRLTVYNKAKVFPEIIEISINQKYIDAVNYTPTFSDVMQRLKWLWYFRPEHFLDFHTINFLTKINLNDCAISNTPDNSFFYDCLKDEHGKVVSKEFNIWHQNWIENGNLYFEYFVSFVMN